MQTVRVNGVDVPIDQFDGADGETTTLAYRKFHQARARESAASSMQTSGSRFIGTPRHQKHKGDASAYGVRIK